MNGYGFLLGLCIGAIIVLAVEAGRAQWRHARIVKRLDQLEGKG